MRVPTSIDGESRKLERIGARQVIVQQQNRISQTSRTKANRGTMFSVACLLDLATRPANHNGIMTDFITKLARCFLTKCDMNLLTKSVINCTNLLLIVIHETA